MQEVQTFSLTSYENEFLQHPDLVMTWAVSDAFIARFGEGFAAYTAGEWSTARQILEETRKARRSADGRKVFLSCVYLSNLLRPFIYRLSNVGCFSLSGASEQLQTVCMP